LCHLIQNFLNVNRLPSWFPVVILVPGGHHWRGARFSLNQETCLTPFRTHAGLLDGANSNFHFYLSGLVLPNIPWIAQESLSSPEGIR
jgi:hypothetical protein